MPVKAPSGMLKHEKSNDENVKCFNVAVLNALEKMEQILWQQQHWIVQ